MRRVFYVLPALGFAVLAFFLFFGLIQPAPDVLTSALIGKSVPAIQLPPLDNATKGFGKRELASGRVTVVNVFASWCVPCRSEASVLAAMAGAHDYDLFGLVYKDTSARARAFLTEVGNPFARIALDSSGGASIDWGVYGVPETYVIDGRGVVRARIVGAVTPEILTQDILPAVARASSDFRNHSRR